MRPWPRGSLREPGLALGGVAKLPVLSAPGVPSPPPPPRAFFVESGSRRRRPRASSRTPRFARAPPPPRRVVRIDARSAAALGGVPAAAASERAHRRRSSSPPVSRECAVLERALGETMARVAAATARPIASSRRKQDRALSFSVGTRPKTSRPPARGTVVFFLLRLRPRESARTRGGTRSVPAASESEEPHWRAPRLRVRADGRRAPASRAASRSSSAALAVEVLAERLGLRSAARRRRRPSLRLLARGGGGAETAAVLRRSAVSSAARSSCLFARGERRRLLRLSRGGRGLAAALRRLRAKRERGDVSRAVADGGAALREFGRRHPRDGFDRLDVRLRLRLHLGSFSRDVEARGGVDGAPRRVPAALHRHLRELAAQPRRAAVTLDEPDPVLLPQTKPPRCSARRSAPAPALSPLSRALSDADASARASSSLARQAPASSATTRDPAVAVREEIVRGRA